MPKSTKSASPKLVIAATAALLCGVMASSGSMAASKDVSMTTPLGITFQAMGTNKPIYNRAKANIQGWAYGDQNGHTLYTYEKDTEGKPTCVAECAASSPPARPIAGAVATGNWTIISHPDGGKQWALGGKPVYTSVKDKVRGENAGAQTEDNQWRTAWYVTEQLQLPNGFSIQDVGSIFGQALTEQSGRTLYTYGGKLKRGQLPPCGTEACIMSPWQPLYAAALAQPKGDFSIVTRDDGTRQWAFKGNALFTYASDKRPDDAYGHGVDQYQAVVLTKHAVPADFKITVANDNGLVFADSKSGNTLYGRNAYVYQNSGHSVRAGINLVPSLARQIGTKACDAECLKSWKPVVPSAKAQPIGFWQITTREDGTKQWTYRDYALYTFVEDKRPGDINGHDRWDLRVNLNPNGDPNPIVQTAVATGLFWTFIFPESVTSRPPGGGAGPIVLISSAPPPKPGEGNPLFGGNSAPVVVAPGGTVRQ